MWHEGLLLTFKDEGILFNAFQLMPHTFGYINTINSIFLTKNDTLCQSLAVTKSIMAYACNGKGFSLVGYS